MRKPAITRVLRLAAYHQAGATKTNNTLVSSRLGLNQSVLSAGFYLLFIFAVLIHLSAFGQLATDTIHGYPITGAASYTTNAGGHTGGASDLAMDLGSGGGVLLRVDDPAFLASVNAATTSDKLSVSLWAQVYSISSSSAFWFFSPTATGNQRGMQAHLPWGNDIIYFDSGGCCDADVHRINAHINTLPGYVDDTWWNSWHHFVFIKNGTTKQIWIDGVLFLSGGAAAALPTDINLLTVGSGIPAPASTPSLRGRIDDFAIFGSGLSSNDVRMLFTGTAPDTLTAANPLAYWSFNPQKPIFAAIQAGPGATVSPDISAYYVVANGSSSVQLNTIKLSVNSTDVTSSASILPSPVPSPIPGGTGATIYYSSPTVFPAGSTQMVSVVFSDNAIPANVFSNSWPVVIQTYNGYVTDTQNSRLGFLEGSAAFTQDKGGFTGKAGDRAIDLNGVGAGGAVHVGSAQFLNRGATNSTLSFSMWMKMQRVPNGGAVFARSPSTGGGERGFAGLAMSDNNIYFDTGGCCDEGQNRSMSSITLFPTYVDDSFWTKWHHYAFVYNAGAKEVWIDGYQFLVDYDFAPLPTDFRDLFFGFSPPDNAYLPALIDDLAAYATPLSAVSISALTNLTSPAALAGETVLAYWNCNTLSPGPPFISLASTPAPGSTNALPNVGANIVIVNRSTQVDTNSIRVALNGTDVTSISTFIASEAGVTINFLSPTLLPPLSTNTVSVVFNDNGSPQFVSSNFWTFKVAPATPYSRDLVKGYLGVFQGTSQFTRGGDGRTGTGADRALDVTIAGSLGARMVDPPFLTDVNRGAAKDTLSVSFWIKQVSIGNSAFWFTSASAGGGRGYQAHCPWTDSTIYFDTAGCCLAPTRISANISGFPGYPGYTGYWTNWHHFAFVKNGGDKQVYIDGQLFMAGTLAAALAPDMTALSIGSANGANRLNGLLDDFAVFAGALSPASITALAAGSSPMTLGDTNLVAFWNFEDAGPPWISSRIPAPGATGVTASGPASQHVIATIVDGSTPVTSGNIRLSFNGTDVTSQLLITTPQPGVTRVEYAPPPLTSGSTNRVTLVFNDAATPPNVVSNTWQYVAEAWTGITKDTLHDYPGLIQYSARYSANGGGRSGQAGDYSMDMTASGGAIHISDATFLRPAGASNTMTFAFWCKKYDNANCSAFWLTSPSSSGTQRGFQTHLPYGNVIYFDTAGCCDTALHRISANISTFPGFVDNGFWTNWHHYAFVYNAGDKTIWIDGQLFLQGTSLNPLPADFTDLFIGRDPPDNLNIHALMDDFATFGSAVTPANIQLLAQGNSAISLADEKLLAYWQFNDAPIRPTISIAVASGVVSITYTGKLQSSDVAAGPYVDVPGATSPYPVNTTAAARKFYRSAP